MDSKLSCDSFRTDSDTSSKSGVNFLCQAKKKEAPEVETPPSCSHVLSTSSTTSSTVSTGYFNVDCSVQKPSRKEPPNIGYELAIAKSILQQYSTLSGDNLFDHLSDIIKRVIDERPPNIIDFFEEFSRNVREQKFHQPERFPPDAIYEESRNFRVAKRILLSMKLPSTENQADLEPAEEMSLESLHGGKSTFADDLTLDLHGYDRLFKTFNERVQQLQFYWNQCGFSISLDDIFQLACSMDRLQTHPSIAQCRFWGVINGLKASYYVVEASLTQEEIRLRLEQMEQEMREKQQQQQMLAVLPGGEGKKEEKGREGGEKGAAQGCPPKCEEPLPSHIGPELTPGIYGWEDYPPEELATMQPSPDPVPVVQSVEVFDIPPEPIGKGLNRFSYFVVNALSDDWIELPIVTPKQIVISRHIKKFFTGDLEAEVCSYPCFPGKEKHYLRAMIARITAGTHVAPRDYYRRMTKKELRLYEGLEDDDEMEEEEEEEEPMAGEGEEETEQDNDVMLLKNEKYEPLTLTMLSHPTQWVHVRPHILNQGRVVWFDEVQAAKDREKELARLLRLQMAGEMDEEEEEEAEEETLAGDEDLEGEEEDLLDDLNPPERGPPLLQPCDLDTSDEFTTPWTARFTSRFTNKIERCLVLRSNVWPGAYTFTFESVCESVYMGWGHKYTSRNMAFRHLPPIMHEHPHGVGDFIETTDPTVAEEEAYRLSLLRKAQQPPDDGEEHMSEFNDEDIASGSDRD